MRTMTPGNFLMQARDIESGNGFWVEKETDLGQWKASTTAVPLSASTTPLLAYAFGSQLPSIYWAAGNSATANLCYRLPADFDAAEDKIRIRFSAAMAGTTDTPAITASGYYARVGDTAPSAFTSVASDAVTGTALAKYDITLSGNGFQPGDDIRIILTPGTHATDILYVTGVAIGYKSSLVAYTKGERG